MKHEKEFYLTLGVLVFLMLLDVVSTYTAVSKGGVEANMAVAPLLDRPFLIIYIKFAAAITTISFYHFTKDMNWSRLKTYASMHVSCVLYLIVNVNNFMI